MVRSQQRSPPPVSKQKRMTTPEGLQNFPRGKTIVFAGSATPPETSAKVLLTKPEAFQGRSRWLSPQRAITTGLG